MPLALRQIGELILEFLLDVVRFPLWWYGGGLKLVANWCWHSFEATRWSVALVKFLQHFFQPMYGDYTFSGRAVSLLMRTFLVVWKTIRLTVTALWYLALLMVWLLLLPWSLVIVFM